MAPARLRRWRRRFRRLALLGGAAAAIGAYRRRKLAENEAKYGAGAAGTAFDTEVKPPAR